VVYLFNGVPHINLVQHMLYNDRHINEHCLIFTMLQNIKQNKIIKKVHHVGTSSVITIDPKIVKILNIDDSTFLSQEAVDDTIIMKVLRLKLGVKENGI
jgi:hypothetical protein